MQRLKLNILCWMLMCCAIPMGVNAQETQDDVYKEFLKIASQDRPDAAKKALDYLDNSQYGEHIEKNPKYQGVLMAVKLAAGVYTASGSSPVQKTSQAKHMAHTASVSVAPAPLPAPMPISPASVPEPVETMIHSFQGVMSDLERGNLKKDLPLYDAPVPMHPQQLERINSKIISMNENIQMVHRFLGVVESNIRVLKQRHEQEKGELNNQHMAELSHLKEQTANVLTQLQPRIEKTLGKITHDSEDNVHEHLLGMHEDLDRILQEIRKEVSGMRDRFTKMEQHVMQVGQTPAPTPSVAPPPSQPYDEISRLKQQLQMLENQMMRPVPPQPVMPMQQPMPQWSNAAPAQYNMPPQVPVVSYRSNPRTPLWGR